jgi:hypothetical protein
MSVYKEYTDYIETFIDLNLDNTEWVFKSHPKYIYMLEHVTQEDGNKYLFEISNRFKTVYNENKDYLIELCNTNDLYGKPNQYLFEGFTKCSPTNLRYILHSLLLLTYMNECMINTIDIIEIGGGYGGLCFFINKLSKLFNITINTYTIFDLDEPLKLQRKYLEIFNINNLTFTNINNFNDLKENSFLVSTYAFSEIPFNLQVEYTNKILNPYISHGFIAWNHIDVYKFIDNKIITEEIEFPLTGKFNKYVRFKPLKI